MTSSPSNPKDIKRAMQKLSTDAEIHLNTSISGSKHSCPVSNSPGHRSASILSKKHKSRSDLIKDYATETEIASVRNPLCDLSNDSKNAYKRKKNSVSFSSPQVDRDVIFLDKENEFGRDSVSPSPSDEIRSPSQQTPIAMLTLEDSPISIEKLTPIRPKSLNFSSPKHISSVFQRTETAAKITKHSPEVQILATKTVFGIANDMCKKAEAFYNSGTIHGQGTSKQSTSSLSKTKTSNGNDVFNIEDEEEDKSDFKIRPSSSGGKLPHYGPRRVVIPNSYIPAHNNNFRDRFHVTPTEIKKYKAICKLASSKYKDEHAVDIGGVYCTFRSFGDSMKPGGVVSNFVNAVFCRHLFMKTVGHPDISKRHYFFSNVGENLLIHPDEANQTVLARAFRRSKKARPLHLSDMLFFPIVFENHWFVFVVDIKDHRFVFLDSYYNQDSEYQQYVRERLIPSFQLHWDKYVDYPNQEQPVDMKFDEYRVLYPPVPHQGLDNLIDCGVFTMMFLENWKSPRTVLTSIFSIEDIPKIRIKFANELMFLPNNIGMKRLVTSYNEEDD